jgi:hypothetical protein
MIMVSLSRMMYEAPLFDYTSRRNFDCIFAYRLTR